MLSLQVYQKDENLFYQSFQDALLQIEHLLLFEVEVGIAPKLLGVDISRRL